MDTTAGTGNFMGSAPGGGICRATMERERRARNASVAKNCSAQGAVDRRDFATFDGEREFA
jgi:hypothetical protein